MDVGLVLLRIVHIVSGAFWVGAAFTFGLFIEPTAEALGPQAGGFMSHLTKTKKFPIVIAISSIVTILAGVLLYWRVSGGLNAAWIQSPTGIGFTVGAVAAIGSFLVGFTVLRPAIDRLGALLVPADGRGRAADSEAQITRLQQRLKIGGRINLVFLGVAVIAMSSARYL